MKNQSPQAKINDKPNMQEEGIYALKILNFDPQIQASALHATTRISNQEKIMKRRQMAQTPSIRYDKDGYDPRRDRRVWSSHEVRRDPAQKLNKITKLQQLNKQIQIISPVLEEKVIQLKNLIRRKPSHSEITSSKMQKIHFTEYVLKSSSPSGSSALHSRKKKECSFMKSVKARRLMHKSTEEHCKKDHNDPFKSIQLNNSSKYASSKRIAIGEEDLVENLKSFKNKKILGKSAIKNYLAHRQSHLIARQRVLSPKKGDQQCRPWETHHGLDQIDDSLIQF